MDIKVKVSAIALRMLLGWFMFFAGIPKVLDPNWTASGFLNNAKTFPGFYSWFGLPGNAWWVDPLNAWGITLIGIALFFGFGVRLAAWGGAILMLLYYFPHYVFPAVDHGFIVDYHIVYIAAFILVGYFAPAQEFGLAGLLRKSFLGRMPVIKSIL